MLKAPRRHPPTHGHPQADTTELGTMGHEFLMLSATLNCSPAEQEYIYSGIRPYVAGSLPPRELWER